MMDGAQINVDVTAPGAIIALALIFLKVCFLAYLASLCTFKNCIYCISIEQYPLNLYYYGSYYRLSLKRLRLDSVSPILTSICSM
jgi:hypothetical protein